uniref:G_PROTEIN_RECEP_F1_2 domain-containing protein n=1 Tax=Ascaris lumbricoides TaxID=6252 RepID=A0A0M3I2W6_ASCLU
MLKSTHSVTGIHECGFENISELVKIASFIPVGLGSTLCNGVIIAAILSQKNIRQRREFQIINALAIADFVEGFSTMIGGVYRVAVIKAGLKNAQFSCIQCMLLPQSWLWRWADFSTSFMLLVLSIDRLISVATPFAYFRLGPTYSRIMVGTPYTLSLLFSMFAWVHPLSSATKISMLCMTREFISATFYQYSKYLTATASALSVFVYIPLLVVMRSQVIYISRKVSLTQVSLFMTYSDRKRRSQLRVTKTIAFSSLCTLLLDAIPRAVGMYGMVEEMKAADQKCDSLFLYLFHLTKLNSMLNVCLYYTRHKPMRTAMRHLFHCSVPPPAPR